MILYNWTLYWQDFQGDRNSGEVLIWMYFANVTSGVVHYGSNQSGRDDQEIMVNSVPGYCICIMRLTSIGITETHFSAVITSPSY